MMQKMHQAFAGGEINPVLWMRDDLAKNRIGAKSLRNCFVHSEGAASNRPGTRFVYDLGSDCRFIPFSFNDEQAYQLVFYEREVMLLYRGAVVLAGDGTPYRFRSPYAVADLERISFTRQLDTLVLTHSDLGEYWLRRYDHTDWRFERPEVIGGPYLPVDVSRSMEIACAAEIWDPDKAYAQGEVVQLGGAVNRAIVGASYQTWYTKKERPPNWHLQAVVTWYTLRLNLSTSHAFGVGTPVYISNLAGADHDFSGSYNVVRVGTDYIEISTSRHSYDVYVDDGLGGYYSNVTRNNFALPTEFSNARVTDGEGGTGFYRALWGESNAASRIISDCYSRNGGTIVRFILPSRSRLYEMGLRTGDLVKFFGSSIYTSSYEILAENFNDGWVDLIVRDGFLGKETGMQMLAEAEDPAVLFNLGNIPNSNPSDWVRTYSWFSLQLKSNSALFAPTDVGRKLRLKGNWSPVRTGSWGREGGETDPIPALGNITIQTGGAWGNTLQLLLTTDDGQSWDLVDEIDGMRGKRNDIINYEITEAGTLFKLKSEGWSEISEMSNELIWTLRVDDGNWVPLSIEAFVDERTVKASVEGALAHAFNSYRFAWGAWGGEQGHPGAVALHQQRMFYARTNELPMTLWATVAGNYHSHVQSPLQLATEAIRDIDLSLAEQYEVRHMVPLKDLLILTSGSWHALTSGEEGLTPTSTRPLVHGYSGSSHLTPLVYDNYLLLVGADLRTVSMLGYRYEVSGYDRTDLVDYSKHLFEDCAITSWARQEDPHKLIWLTTDTGQIRCLTFDSRQQVAAWTPGDTLGDFVRVGSVKSPAGQPDDVCFLTRRFVDGADRYYIEHLTDRRDQMFLDCALSYEGDATTEISGLEHLEGRTDVAVWVDGQTYFDQTVSGGTLQLPGDIIFSLPGFPDTVVVPNVFGGYYKRLESEGTPSVAVEVLIWFHEGLARWEYYMAGALRATNSSTLRQPPPSGWVAVEGGELPVYRRVVEGRKAHVGLPMVSEVEPIPLDTRGEGVLLGRKRTVREISLLVKESKGVEVGTGEDRLKIPKELHETYSGELKVSQVGNWTDQPRVLLRQRQAEPMTIQGLVAELEVGG